MTVHSAVLSVAALVSAGTVLTILWHEKRSIVRAALAGLLLLLALESIAVVLVLATSSPGPMITLCRIRMALLAPVPGCLVLFGLCYARGDFEQRLERWRSLVRLSFLFPIAVAGLGFPGLTLFTPGTEFVAHTDLRIGWSGVALVGAFILASVFALTQLEQTLRGSVGTMRWRIKFVVLGASLLLVVRIYTGSQLLLGTVATSTLEILNACGLLLASGMFLYALRRGHLRSAELYLSHRAIYFSLTLVVAGAYLLMVGILARLTVALGGEAALALQSFLVLAALLGLTVLLLSNRVRRHAGRLISRHFSRPEHDYRRVWTAFAKQTTSSVDLPAYARAAAGLTAQTLDVLSVTIWIVDQESESLHFGASTTLSDAEAMALMDTTHQADILTALAEPQEPLVLTDSPSHPLAALRHRLPEAASPNTTLCLPLRSGNHLVGAMVIGDRVGDIPFSTEDMDLLHTIGIQLGANLWTRQLSEQLANAKELAAFQTMSTFFIHDLKNTASTLGLTLQNLPRHFDDPAFREDALRAMGKSVERVNDLVQRLTDLRQSLEIHLADTDLNELVTTTLSSLNGSLPVEPELTLGPLPPVAVDPEQFRRVLENLLVNAREAIGADGHIEIETEARNGRVMVTVRDDGCGMTPSFIETSLFRPFSSTKKKGMGIGLFQSRMIVEAHHGRINVHSAPDQGTTFQVILPTNP